MAKEVAQGRPMTFGEKAVGLSFNPSGDENVNTVKKLYAQIIDQLDGLRSDPNITSNTNAIFTAAIQEAMTAQMWAVKAITYKD